MSGGVRLFGGTGSEDRASFYSSLEQLGSRLVFGHEQCVAEEFGDRHLVLPLSGGIMLRFLGGWKNSRRLKLLALQTCCF